MVPTLDIAGLLSLLHAGETVILPSPRAAGELRRHFDREQRKKGLRAWQPAPVLSWDGWLESLWSGLTFEGIESRILLNPLQERHIWEGVIGASREGTQLPKSSLRQLATLASSALRLAAAHEGLRLLKRTGESPDAQAFVGWQENFLQQCSVEQLLPRALLPATVTSHLRSRTLPMPSTLRLAGFEDLQPDQQTLLAAARSLGCQVEIYSLQSSPASTALQTSVGVPDPEEEVRWAARWLRRYLENCTEPAPRIALIFPNPAAERPTLEPLLREVLTPELQSVDADLSSTPWHFAAGPPLSSLPLIRDALALLRWLHEDLLPDEISALLLSPFLRHTDEEEMRARFEAGVLRRDTRLRPELGLAAFLEMGRNRGLLLPELGAIYRLAGEGSQIEVAGSHADWAEFLRKLLKSAGWPGQRALSPLEFRASEAWDGLLDLLATLDFRAGRIPFHDFLDLLHSQARAMSTPSPLAGAAIEIVSLPEAEGCFFDLALVLRSTDEHLPSPERTHPLLGWEFQRLSHLPGTDSAATHARSLNQVRALRERCGDVLLLHAEADENGAIRPTPLAAELGFQTKSSSDLVSEYALPPQIPTHAFMENTLLPLPDLNIGGGARLLELQAACAFRAFASLRLASSLPEDLALGLSARQRGSLLHNALERFWGELQTQAVLRDLSADQREAAVRWAVEGAFCSLRKKAATGWDRAYLEVCESRLCALIESWLEHELGRSDFAVLPPEQEQSVLVGPLQLKVRPDRIDRVGDPDGGYVFIDYKTSADLSIQHWLGERPHAPQLPLYTLLAEADEVRGLAFARLRPGKDMKWIGLQKQEGDLRHKRGIKLHDLEWQIAEWRDELARLASEFAAGVTTVNPKSYPKTCTYCEQRLLCRLDAAKLLTGVEDELGGEKESDG